MKAPSAGLARSMRASSAATTSTGDSAWLPMADASSATDAWTGSTIGMAAPSPSLHLGRRLPLHEGGVDLLQELRVDDAVGGDLLLDPVQRVEEVHELPHALVDLVVHLHR